jgi:type 2 lantibiotic biosynthesis protein LanM
MDPFYDRLILRAATIDEILSEDVETLPGQKGDADLAARRLAAWCSACASGDWLLFNRRLERDGLALHQVLARFATVRRRPSAAPPAWFEDAIWIEAALGGPAKEPGDGDARFPFADLFAPVVEQAESRLWASVSAPAAENLSSSARACLRQFLLEALCDLPAAALYERFARGRRARLEAGHQEGAASSIYEQFVADMRKDGFRRLFEERPVLLRLIASLTRQWLATSREFVLRLGTDLPALHQEILQGHRAGRVARIEGGLSDPHHGGHSVLVVVFENGSQVVYKPKDLRVEAAWHALVERLNRAGAPVELRAMRVLARDDYGWTEYIEHTTTTPEGCGQFFRRAGAWLALFHCFAGSDIHQENMIAAGDHPVPIDLETILQAAAAEKTDEPEAQASEAAQEIIAGSVLAVGLLPAYGRAAGNEIYVVGGVASDWTSGTKLKWNDINSDKMRPAHVKVAGKPTANLAHVAGRYARFGDHLSDFLVGFEEYAKFLLSRRRVGNGDELFDGFAGLPVRKVVRPTQFYYMLLQRLKDDRTMEDGILWSAQADFLARLADWEKDHDPAWPLRRAERAALIELNVPRFVLPSDGNELSDTAGTSVRIETTPGLERACSGLRSLSEQEIAWQIDVIRQSTSSVSGSPTALSGAGAPRPLLCSETAAAPSEELFVAEADRIAAEVSRHAIRRGSGAAWIGLGWLGDSEVSQLTVLGPDLYNGACGIALFFAAHAMARQRASSADLAIAAVSQLRKDLHSRAAARFARSLGIGGATGLGSIVYALTVMANLLEDADLLRDAHRAAELMSDDLIAADKQLDVIGGSAGAILGLLRLYRDTQSEEVLRRVGQCGEHLLTQPRAGVEGCRSWRGQTAGSRPLTGMSHGAAGFACALSLLAAATGREDFAVAASECIRFESASYDAEHNNWPDFREAEPHWPCRWCHGAVGIGLARLAMRARRSTHAAVEEADIRNALAGAARGWPGDYDTLCCGALGSVEFFSEAGKALARADLSELASRRLAAVVANAAASGDYRWNGGARRFNLGLFRGLAGVGYTCLRQLAGSLANVLIWE